MNELSLCIPARTMQHYLEYANCMSTKVTSTLTHMQMHARRSIHRRPAEKNPHAEESLSSVYSWLSWSGSSVGRAED